MNLDMMRASVPYLRTLQVWSTWSGLCLGGTANPGCAYFVDRRCASAHNGRPVVHCAYGCQEENQKEADQENCAQEGEANQEGAQGETGEEGRSEKGGSENEGRR